MYESKPTRLPLRAALAAAAPADLRPGAGGAGPGGAGKIGRGAVRALRLSAAAAAPGGGAVPAPGRAPAAPGAAPRPHAATPQKAAGEQRPRYAAVAEDNELFGEKIEELIESIAPFLRKEKLSRRTSLGRSAMDLSAVSPMNFSF